MAEDKHPSFLKKLVIPTSRQSLEHPKHKLTEENRNVLLVAATLIAAVTFQAGVSPPGGCWQDTTPIKKLDGLSPPAPPGYAPAPSSPGEEQHIAGHAIYSSQRVPFHIFLICNTLSLSSSIFLLLCLTFGYPFFLEVVIASISMLVTYGSAIFAVTPSESVHFRLIFLSAAGPVVIRALISLISHGIKRMQGKTSVQENNSVQKINSDIEAKKQGD